MSDRDVPPPPEGGPSPWGAIDPELAERMRPRVAAAVEAVIAAVRAEVPEYDQPLEGAFGRLISQGVTAGLDQFVSLLGTSGGEVPDESLYEALGRAEFRAGRTLDALQSAYRVGARVSWRQIAGDADEAGLDVATLGRLAEAIFAYIDRLSAASVRGYSQEQSLRAGSLQTRRQELVELLVSGPVADPAVAREAAARADWELPASVAVLAVGDADPAVIGRRMPAGSIAAALRPVGVLLVPDPGAPGRRAQVRRALRDRRGVLGPGGPWTEAHVSYARAVAAWPLHEAGRLGSDKLAVAREHLLALLLAGDVELTTELVRLRLGPLEGGTPAAQDRAIQTLEAWLNAHGDVTATAEALHVHPQTVRYRLAGLRERLGDAALDDPARRVELQLALRARRLLAE